MVCRTVSRSSEDVSAFATSWKIFSSSDCRVRCLSIIGVEARQPRCTLIRPCKESRIAGLNTRYRQQGYRVDCHNTKGKCQCRLKRIGTCDVRFTTAEL